MNEVNIIKYKRLLYKILYIILHYPLIKKMTDFTLHQLLEIWSIISVQ